MRAARRVIVAQPTHAHGQHQTTDSRLLDLGMNKHRLETRIKQGRVAGICRLLRSDGSRQRDLGEHCGDVPARRVHRN
ncbi:Uncharacterised protein [Mycobacterium tuberculosis]|uniref:Uncharacterized protein n=1 Tax=Mycobacterium tuberculosis TaxID=1773 RepID=A0A0U0R3W8_MYCTX|nr:Uncharacterised protein [Mycobacterium tuberculosis]COV67880.1 Uncharacterised protein [Mycobacterium tuberculosis]COW00682.1 Uncharacterised protein [Mycobacterium tuberculosis]